MIFQQLTTMEIIGPDLKRAADCEAILRSVPEWFGIEDALLMYVRESEEFPGFAVEGPDGLIGFLTLSGRLPCS